MLVTDSLVHIEVDDGSSVEPTVQPLDPLRTGGMGMRLVESFADAWGVTHEAGGGKTVWADMACA